MLIAGNGDHACATLTPSTPSGDGEGSISLYEIYRMKMQYFAGKFAPTFVVSELSQVEIRQLICQAFMKQAYRQGDR